MSVTAKVVWSEGMFLRPQHFQQQDRHIERYIGGRCSAMGSYFWGMQEIEIDSEPLQLGKVSITQAKGIFADGTPFSIPDNDEVPAIIDIPENTQNEIIYLCIPLSRSGSLDVVKQDEDGAQARYHLHQLDARNNSSESGESARIQVGKLRIVLRLGSDDLSGYACIGVARVVQRQPDKPVKLDKDYIPPVLNCITSNVLKAYYEELMGLLKQRGEALGHRLSDSGRAGSAEIADYLLLQVVNRVEPLIKHQSQLQMVHPLTFYTELVQIAGELATFTNRTKRPDTFPQYQHEYLQDTFSGIFTFLRQYLSAVLEQTAISLKLSERKYGIFVAPISDHSLLSSASFILAVKADVSGEIVRNHFPLQTKIAPVEIIRNLISAQLPGLTLHLLPVAPRQIPYHAGFAYFELERSGEVWEKLKDSGGIAVHVGAELPGLDMELWVVRD